MTKEQQARRQATIDELALAYPEADAEKLQDELYKIAVKLARNAERLCAEATYADRRPSLRKELQKVAERFGVALVFEVVGDSRGYPLRLKLPTERYNSFDGVSWGIATN